MASGAGTAKTGDFGIAVAGRSGTAVAGDCGAAEAGEHGTAMAGEYGRAKAGGCGMAAAGKSAVAESGDRGVAASRGSVSVGDFGVGAVLSRHPRVKGGLGAVLTIALEDTDGSVVAWASLKIGGTYRPDTWYTLDAAGNVVPDGGAEKHRDETKGTQQ